MAILSTIKIKNGELPDEPGVYLYYNVAEKLLYVGKATSLKKRVTSYFSSKYQHADDVYARRISKMVSEIATIDYVETPTVIEALVLEANYIRAKQPYYNVLLQDDRSFLFLVFTNEDYPKPVLKRGLELAREGINPFMTAQEIDAVAGDKYLAVYGPFTSPGALRKALELLRKIFPWSECEPPSKTGKNRPCFYAHIKLCPGVCTGMVTRAEYKKTIRGLMRFFDGKKMSVIHQLEKQMKAAAHTLAFEQAGELKRRIFELQHIRDIAVLTRDFSPLPYENPDKDFVNALGRVEAYDISNTAGTHSVGSMVVFESGQPEKSKYRQFKIKTVEGPNDVASLQEVILRRLKRAETSPKAWPLPDVMVIDGGKPQVNAVQAILDQEQVRVPIVGLSKGADRKKDELIYNQSDTFLARVVQAQKPLFQKARDEAHRFAQRYHKQLRGKVMKGGA
ncbi:TPA: hypothetical protein DEB00_03640 [Candidatus Uhrbacteria bacterium]|nr:hypothetical protein [Candidatus Uhrbacteria bacterium]